MPENLENTLPFKIQESQLLSDSGEELEVQQMIVKDNTDVDRNLVLKESRSVELANNIEMQKLKSFYEFMKNDPDFGKFVIDTHFVKAQSNSTEPARAYLVQKFIPGKRIDEMTDEEIYNDRALAAELLEFVKASISMLEKTKSTPEQTPDFYADKKSFLGNALHNPRYSGNILIADSQLKKAQRVYFVDTGTLFGPGHDKSFLKTLLRPIDGIIQLAQMKRWADKLEQYLK